VSQRRGGLGVAAVVRRTSGLYLVVQRAPGRIAEGYWTPVTGGVEPGESIEDAAVREVAEEVGLAVRAGERFYEHPTHDGRWQIVWLTTELVASAESSDPCALELATDEIAAARWLALDEIEQLEPMFEATRRGFELAEQLARRQREP